MRYCRDRALSGAAPAVLFQRLGTSHDHSLKQGRHYLLARLSFVFFCSFKKHFFIIYKLMKRSFPWSFTFFSFLFRYPGSYGVNDVPIATFSFHLLNAVSILLACTKCMKEHFIKFYHLLLSQFFLPI